MGGFFSQSLPASLFLRISFLPHTTATVPFVPVLIISPTVSSTISSKLPTPSPPPITKITGSEEREIPRHCLWNLCFSFAPSVPLSPMVFFLSPNSFLMGSPHCDEPEDS